MYLSHDQWIALAFWLIMFYPIYSPRCWRIRRQHRKEQAK